jgi:hypothetical protein
MPLKTQGYIDGWRRLLPDYEIIKWNADNFDINSVDWVRQAVRHKKWAFATDYVRFWIIYNHGGIYLDSDVELLCPFGDELMELPYFLGMEKAKGIVESAVFGAEPKTKWLEDCMNYYRDREFILGENKFDTLPLPYIMLKVLKQNYGLKLIQNPNNFSRDSKSIQILPPKYFSPKRWNESYAQVYSCTRTIHHLAGDWNGAKNNLARVLKNKIADFLGEDFYTKMMFKIFAKGK